MSGILCNRGYGYNALYRYTPEGYLGELVNRAAGGTEVSHHMYQYDPLGRRTGHREAIAGAETDYTYQYDALDRLREVRTNAGATLFEAYAYDAYGNRRARTAPDGSIQRYAYDAAQQLRQIRSGSDTGAILASYTYDPAGNLTQRSGGGATLTLSYDALERLVAASGTGIAPETYVYDHEDRRIETTVDGTPRRSVYAGLAIWSDYGSAWTQAQALYTDAGLDRPLIRTDAGGGTAYYHADALGSVVAVTNAAGAITASARYSAFGQTLAGGALPRYGYAGREPDATGLIYYRARYYDPQIGRFTQRDPAGFADGLNPYAYVGNNPVSFTDPLGLNKAAPMASSNVSGYQGAPSTGSSLLNELRTTASAFLDVARKNPAIGIAAAPATDFAEGITSGDTRQIAFNALTADLPGAKLGVGVLGAVIKNADNVADVTKSGEKLFDIHPRVTGQLNDSRMGSLAGKLSPGDFQRLANNPSAQRVFDARSGNINVIQNVEGKLLRITVPRDEMKIISVGPIRPNQVTNRIESGDFIPLP